MKKRSLYLSILLFPFLGMIVINECVRLTTPEKGYHTKGITAINSAVRTPEKCSWICHNDTDYCKNNHVKLMKPYFEYIDPLYFGIITSLKSTGDYRLANIVFLVILIPAIIYYPLIKSISLQIDINKLKNDK